MARAKEWPGLAGVDYVKEVTHKKAFRWDEKDEQSASFNLTRGAAKAERAQGARSAAAGGHSDRGFDFGMKYNILRRLRQHGFKVAGGAGDDDRRRGAEAQAGRNFSFQRPRRSGGAGLRGAAR